MAINVSIVEDDCRIRENLVAWINGTENIRCISAYPTAEAALSQLAIKRPDVVLMDLNLPNMSGIECVRQLKVLMPELQILMVALYEDDEQVFQSLAAGANGYLVKRTSSAELLAAIDGVHSGASPMSGKMARVVVEYFHKLQHATQGQEQLSKREQEILDLLSKGYRYKEIADALSVSFEAIRSHLSRICEKLRLCRCRSSPKRVIKPDGQGGFAPKSP